MNALKRLTIENYQSHQKSIIEPAPAGHLTVIVGPSDTGKTVIIRSTKWLSSNTPQGTDYIREGASFARVTEEFESGHTVIRERTKSANRYKIVAPVNSGINEPQVFEGFGNDVPLEVQEITGIRPVSIGDLTLNLNFADQLQGPFLGSSVSAPARAKVLGKLAGTEEIDHAGKTLGTDLYRRNQDEKRLKGELVALDEDIAKYDYLPARAARINKLEQLVAKIKVTQERRNRLAALKQQMENVRASWMECRRILQRWECLDVVGQEVGKAESAKARLLNLEHKRDRWVTLEDYIADCYDKIDAWQGVEQAESSVKGAELNGQRRQQIAKYKDSLFNVTSAITEADSVLVKLQDIDNADNIVKGVAVLARSRLILADLLKTYQNIAGSINATEAILARLAGVNEAAELSAEVVALKERRSTVNGRTVEFKSMERMGKESREQAVLWENRVAELEGAYWDELVSAGVCPVCNSVIIPEKLKEVC
jgi:DNA repair protein SbcC/Rad50